MSKPHYTQTETKTDDAIAGVRVAIVRDNEDPENLGRFKLEYPWRDADDESHWARMATEMTGDGYGTHFLPEVEDEVLVGFENGDIHQPIVMGSLYSGNRTPPETNADGNNDIRAITTRSGHKVEFDDNDQSGAVTIETNAGHTVVLDDESGGESITVEDKSGNSIEMDAVGNSISISAQQEISLEAPTIDLSADGEVSISSKGKVDVSGDGQASVSSKGQLNLESTGIMGIDATGPLTIQGAIIQLN
jgi:uncharacterized protein involved in type VI secretion and phage assembly